MKIGMVCIGGILLVNANAQSYQLEWVDQCPGSNFNFGIDITTDPDGNVIATGKFEATADFDPGVGAYTLTAVAFEDVYVQKLDPSGNLIWAKSFGGSISERGQAVTTDATGNIYVGGNFMTTVDFDPGAGTTSYTAVGSRDAYVVKLDPNGDFLWANTMGSTGWEEVWSLDIDLSGNLLVTGVFEGTVDFDSGAGTSNLVSAGGKDIFIQKLDASGNLIWAKSIGGTGEDYAYSVTHDASANVFATGYFAGTVDFDPGAGTALQSAVGDRDLYVLKLDDAGDLDWVSVCGGTQLEYGRSVVVDPYDNVYVVGDFMGTVDFDPGAGTSSATAVSGSRDFFVQKLNPTGTLDWVKTFGGTLWEGATDISTDPYGNVFITGTYAGTVDFDPGAGTASYTATGSYDMYILYLDLNGNYQWVKVFDGASYAEASSIVLDSSGHLYLTGEFQSTVDFDPGPGTAMMTSFSSADIFVLRLSSTVGNKELNTMADMAYYPSPTTGDLTINLGANCTNVQVLVTDMLGQVVQQKTLSETSQATIQLIGAPGMYLVTVLTNDQWLGGFKVMKE